VGVLHRQHNGIDDSILIDVYADIVGAKAEAGREALRCIGWEEGPI
jgi:hypothetical protein